MKNKKNRLRFAWILLICFIAGQTMVYSHQHLVNHRAISAHTTKAPQPVQTLTEKCSICDMMHHTQMAIFDTNTINATVTICNTHYTRQHDYKGIALILSEGRSPPSNTTV